MVTYKHPAPAKIIAQWQAYYDRAVGKPGRVVDVFARLGHLGSLAIWVQIEHPDGSTLYYAPYLDCAPGDRGHDVCVLERNPAAWLDGVARALDWGSVDWGPGEASIPAH